MENNDLSVFKYHVPLKRKLKFAKQRVNRGFADCDVWDLDYYLLTVLPQMLRHLAKNSQSWPLSVANSHEEWVEYLLSIADKFDKAAEKIDNFEDPQPDFAEAWALMGEIMFELWD